MPPDPPFRPDRLIAASGGFLGPSRQARRIRRILELAASRPRFGLPKARDAVLAWGHSPRAYRAEALAQRRGAALWRVEDAFIRSLAPGRAGKEPPMGLLLDLAGVYYDPSVPSDLETLLSTHPLDDGALMARARVAQARIRALHLSKYNQHDPGLPPPEPGYVLVIDQVRGDASLSHGHETGALQADRLFREMLIRAQEVHGQARVLIRAHPETSTGQRAGHYGPQDAPAGGRVSFVDGAHSPWTLFDGAIAVYTVSSQMGFESVLAGHRPRVFGQPFYAGWGLSDDEDPPQRRRRRLTRTQLFAAAMMLYPLWYDPLRDRLCELEEIIDQMEARLRAYREDRGGYVAIGMRAWKRPALQAFFGREKPLVFARDPGAPAGGRRVLGWASAVPDSFDGVRVEDGFIRSAGLGASLVPPLSLAVDDLGIYYDPRQESRLERLIAGPLPAGGTERAARLRDAVLRSGVTKYNLAPGVRAQGLADHLARLRATRPDAPAILIPGQVEDDASILLGAGGPVRTNRALLQAARAAHPHAILIYKPHPDVEAGLRPGAVPDAATLADIVLDGIGAQPALALADEVWTLTSGLGFEALLRGRKVTCLGTPFYAGWGLTRDLGPVPRRRLGVFPRPDLDRLVHAALIAYPRYLDPVTGIPCPPELAIERLAAGRAGRGSIRLRIMSRLQGALASHTWLWRR